MPLNSQLGTPRKVSVRCVCVEGGEEHVVKSPECMLVRKSSFHSMVFISLGTTDIKDRPRQGVEGKKLLKQTKEDDDSLI